jgi:hypothetical protein
MSVLFMHCNVRKSAIELLEVIRFIGLRIGYGMQLKQFPSNPDFSSFPPLTVKGQ